MPDKKSAESGGAVGRLGEFHEGDDGDGVHFKDGELLAVQMSGHAPYWLSKEETRELYEAMRNFYGDSIKDEIVARLFKIAGISEDCPLDSIKPVISGYLARVQDFETIARAEKIRQAISSDGKYNTHCTASNCPKDCKSCQARCLFRMFEFQE